MIHRTVCASDKSTRNGVYTLFCFSLSTKTCLPPPKACLPTKACLLKLCTSHIHIQHVHDCISQQTLHHEADSIPWHTASIHAHPRCCQASLCSFHQVGLASNIPPTCHNGTPWVLDQAAHAQVSPYLHNSSDNINTNDNIIAVMIMIMIMTMTKMMITITIIATTRSSKCSMCVAQVLSCQADLFSAVHRSDAHLLCCNAQLQLLSLWVHLL